VILKKKSFIEEEQLDTVHQSNNHRFICRRETERQHHGDVQGYIQSLKESHDQQC